MKGIRNTVDFCRDQGRKLFEVQVDRIYKGKGKKCHWNIDVCQNYVRRQCIALFSALGIASLVPVGYGVSYVADFIDDLYVSEEELVELSQQFYGQLEIPYSVAKSLRITFQKVTGETLQLRKYPEWMERVRGENGVVQESLEEWIRTRAYFSTFSQIQGIVDLAQRRCNLEEWTSDAKEKGLISRVNLIVAQFVEKYPFFQDTSVIDLKEFLRTPLVLRFEHHGEKKEYSFYEFFTRWKQGEVSHDEFLMVMEQTRQNGFSLNDLFLKKDGYLFIRVIKNSLGANETFESIQQKKKFLDDFLHLYETIAREVDAFAIQYKFSSFDVLYFSMMGGVEYKNIPLKTTKDLKSIAESMARRSELEELIPKMLCGGGFKAELTVPKTAFTQEQLLSALYTRECITHEKTSLSSPQLIQDLVSAWFFGVGVSAEVQNEKLGKAKISCTGSHPIVFEKP